MSDISILMTGVLATGQSTLPEASLSNVLEEPLVQLENQNLDRKISVTSIPNISKGSKSGGTVLSDFSEGNRESFLDQNILAQITPPEFVKPQLVYADRNSWNLALQRKNILRILRQKVHSHQFSRLLGLRIGAKKIREQVIQASAKQVMNGNENEVTLPKITEKPTFLEQPAIKILIARSSNDLTFESLASENLTPNDKEDFESDRDSESLPSSSTFVPRKTFFSGGTESNFSGRTTFSRRIRRTRSRMPILRFGNSGLSVKVLQKLLLSNGYAVRIDGSFGALTEAAVRGFQDTNKLSVDGIVGGNTWGALSDE